MSLNKELQQILKDAKIKHPSNNTQEMLDYRDFCKELIKNLAHCFKKMAANGCVGALIFKDTMTKRNAVCGLLDTTDIYEGFTYSEGISLSVDISKVRLNGRELEILQDELEQNELTVGRVMTRDGYALVIEWA